MKALCVTQVQGLIAASHPALLLGLLHMQRVLPSHHSDARNHKRHWMDVNPQSWLLPLRRVRCIVMFSDLSSGVGRDLSGLCITLQLRWMRVRYSTAVLRVCSVWRRLATPTRCVWSAAQCRTAGLGRPARSHVLKEFTQNFVI